MCPSSHAPLAANFFNQNLLLADNLPELDRFRAEPQGQRRKLNRLLVKPGNAGTIENRWVDSRREVRFLIPILYSSRKPFSMGEPACLHRFDH
jgi:hypothetical protein